MSFQKSLSLYGVLATSLSCMIGSGWLFASFISMQFAGPAAIISWIIGGFLIILIALTYAEIGAMLPVEGGIARYAQLTYGSSTSFIISWFAWISSGSAAPSEVQATIIYLSQYFSDLSITKGLEPMLTTKGTIISYLLLLIFTVINLYGIKIVSYFNNSMALWKVMIPLLISLVIGGSQLHFENFYLYGGFAPHGIKGILMAVSTTIVFSYLGFREITSLGSEIQNPQKTMPYAVVGSVLFAMLFYVLIQGLFIIALPAEYLNNSWTLDKINYSSPVLDLSIILGLSWISSLIYLDSMITPSGTALIYITTSSRLNYAVSKNVQAPRFLGDLNSYDVPYKSIITNYIIGCFLLGFFPSWQLLIKFQTTAIILAYTIGPLSLIAFRQLYPNLKRPFKLPQYQLLSFLAFYSCTLLIYWTGWEVISLMSIVLMIGVAFFMSFRLYTNQTLPDLHFSSCIWIIYYILGLTIISFFGSYGGSNLIELGYDLLLLLLHSFITLSISNKSMLSIYQSKEQSKLCHSPVNA